MSGDRPWSGGGRWMDAAGLSTPSEVEIEMKYERNGVIWDAFGDGSATRDDRGEPMSDDRLAEIKAHVASPHWSFAGIVRNDVPWLIAEVERLRVALAESLDNYQSMKKNRDDFCASFYNERAELVAVRAALQGLREFAETVVALCVPMEPPADEGPMPPVMAKVLLSLAEKPLAAARTAAAGVLNREATE